MSIEPQTWTYQQWSVRLKFGSQKEYFYEFALFANILDFFIEQIFYVAHDVVLWVIARLEFRSDFFLENNSNCKFPSVQINSIKLMRLICNGLNERKPSIKLMLYSQRLQCHTLPTDTFESCEFIKTDGARCIMRSNIVRFSYWLVLSAPTIYFYNT